MIDSRSQSSRPASQRDPLILTKLSCSRWRNFREVEAEIDIVGNEQVNVTIPVIVDEGTARIPAPFCPCHTRLFCELGEGSVTIVVIKAVLAVIGYEEVVVAVVVVIGDTDSLSPAGVRGS